MQDILIPPKYLVHCLYCHEALNSNEGGIYHRGTAWFKQQKRARSGTNSACLVKWLDEWACTFCINKILNNIPIEQMTLFTMPIPDEPA